MGLNSFEATQGTQTALLTDNTGGVSGTLIPVMKIDTSAQGTAGAIWGGSITGVGTLPGIGVVTSLTNGSVNIPNGTIQALGTLGTIGLATVAGNLTSVGTIGTVGLATITGNIGTIGTLGLGTITGNLGTIGTLGTLLNQGSLTNVGQVYNAGTLQNQLAGTITALQNGTITAGSIVIIAGTQSAGTLNTGTINTGTFSLLPLPGSVLTTSVNIGTTAGTAAIPTTALTNRKALIAYNIGTSLVYIGGTGVGTTTGIPIGTASYTPSFDLGTGALYGIAATPGGTLIALEIS